MGGRAQVAFGFRCVVWGGGGAEETRETGDGSVERRMGWRWVWMKRRGTLLG